MQGSQCTCYLYDSQDQIIVNTEKCDLLAFTYSLNLFKTLNSYFDGKLSYIRQCDYHFRNCVAWDEA